MWSHIWTKKGRNRQITIRWKEYIPIIWSGIWNENFEIESHFLVMSAEVEGKREKSTFDERRERDRREEGRSPNQVKAGRLPINFTGIQRFLWAGTNPPIRGAKRTIGCVQWNRSIKTNHDRRNSLWDLQSSPYLLFQSTSSFLRGSELL